MITTLHFYPSLLGIVIAHYMYLFEPARIFLDNNLALNTECRNFVFWLITLISSYSLMRFFKAHTNHLDKQDCILKEFFRVEKSTELI